MIDPEDFSSKRAAVFAKLSQKAGASIILVGGSTIASQRKLDEVVKSVKLNVTIPVILFPGNITGISQYADAILFSSLLNSSNPYFIIGAQAIGSAEVRRSKIEPIPMGYLVFGSNSTTSFVGQTLEIPREKPSIAVMYALAAYYLGMRTIYLEAGSGAVQTVPPETIKAVRKYYEGTLIVGGGITGAEQAKTVSKAGADIIVVGNLLSRPDFEKKLKSIIEAIRN